MATTTRKPVRKPSKVRSKAEVADEFEAVRGEEPEALDRVSLDAKKAEKARVLAATSSISIDKMVTELVSLGPTIQQNLIELSTVLTQKTQELADIKAAVDIAKEELKEVHAIEVSATALENLIEDYKRREIDLKTQITDLQNTFAASRAAAIKEDSELKKELDSKRMKEDAEFRYNLEQVRLKERTAYENAVQDLTRINSLRQQGLEAGWAERTKELDARTKELEEYKVKVAGFDEETRKAVAKAEAIVSSSIKRDLTHAFELEKRDLTSKISMLEQKELQAAADKLAMAKSITELQARLENANKQIENIATKALESASGNLAMSKMKEVIDSSPNGGSGKRQ